MNIITSKVLRLLGACYHIPFTYTLNGVALKEREHKKTDLGVLISKDLKAGTIKGKSLSWLS